MLGAARRSTLSFTYANEWEDYTISEETLADPTFRDELIALGSNPEDRLGQRPAVGAPSSMPAATPPTTCSTPTGLRARRARSNTPAAGSAATTTTTSSSAEGRYYMPSATARWSRCAPAAARSTRLGQATDSSVPFFKRYFLGGATNLRGWGRFESRR